MSNLNQTPQQKKLMNIDCKRNEDSPLRVPPTPLLKKIGYGTGVGVYRLDRSPRTGNSRSPWALKKVNRKIQRGNVIQRLQKEADILQNLNHPNIIGFRAFGVRNGREVLAMEEGGEALGNMVEYRRENGLPRFTKEDISKVIMEVCKALHYIHDDCKIIHGDIKSYNILIKDNFETVKLCDFGVSMPLNENCEADDYIGTEAWSAPEVLIDGPVTPKADIFSLGLTIWEMFTLQIPHHGSETEVMDDDCYELNSSENYGKRPLIPQELGSEYSRIVDLFNWCTEEDFHKRPSASDILYKLGAIC